VFEVLAYQLLMLSGKFNGSYVTHILTPYHRVYSTLHQLSHTVQFNLSVTDVQITAQRTFLFVSMQRSLVQRIFMAETYILTHSTEHSPS
jgi:hypothetical protein